MIGIVVLNYINYHVTLNCVESILHNPPHEDYKIFIIDNGSPNESSTVLKNRFENNYLIRLFVLPDNIGFARACNFGLHLCREAAITECILSNSDIVFPVNSIDQLITDIRTLNNAIIVGPKIYNPIDKCIQHSSRLEPPSTLEPFEVYRVFKRLFKAKEIEEDSNSGKHQVYLVSGCCFALNVDKFQHVGDFDSNTFLYNEENIIGHKAKQAGYCTYIDLDVSILHNHGSSSGRRNDFTCVELIKSTLYYWKTYRGMCNVSLFLILLIFSFKIFLLSFVDKNLHSSSVFKEGLKFFKT